MKKGLIFLAGALLTISTYLFSFKLPNISNEIQRSQGELDLDFHNCDLYAEFDDHATIQVNQKYILEEIKADPVSVKKVSDRIKFATQVALTQGYLCAYDRLPTDLEKESWASMDEDQIIQEHNNFVNQLIVIQQANPGFRESAVESLDKTRGWEKLFKVIAIISQVLGVVIVTTVIPALDLKLTGKKS